ncbi:MAG: hypothetical protein MRY57_01975 [Candidatus Pacebacteria bacterium]|nr:hypothetical protein [Candidatus Paceibacterota bacterium]
MSTETHDSEKESSSRLSLGFMIFFIGLALVLLVSFIDWNGVFNSSSNNNNIAPATTSIPEKTIGLYTETNNLVPPMYTEMEYRGNVYENYTEVTLYPNQANPYFYGGDKRIKLFFSKNGNNIVAEKVKVYGSNGESYSFTEKTPDYGKSVRFTTNQIVTIGVAVYK